jgi:hypothetical protein
LQVCLLVFSPFVLCMHLFLPGMFIIFHPHCCFGYYLAFSFSLCSSILCAFMLTHDCLLISHPVSLQRMETVIGFFWLPSLLFFKVDAILFMLLFMVQVLKSIV